MIDLIHFARAHLIMCFFMSCHVILIACGRHMTWNGNLLPYSAPEICGSVECGVWFSLHISEPWPTWN